MQTAGDAGVLDRGRLIGGVGARGSHTVSGVTLTIGPTSPVSPFSPKGPGRPCAGRHSTDPDDQPTRAQLQVDGASSALPSDPTFPPVLSGRGWSSDPP